MTIVHPGPWTQLPPAPAPVPSPRSKSVSNQRGLWYRPKVPPPNPFAEEMDEDTREEAEDRTKPSVPASQSESGCNTDDNVMDKRIPPKKPDLKEAAGGGVTDAAEEGGSLPGPHATSDVTQCHILPRSLSVPAITSAHSQRTFEHSDLTETNASVTPSHSKV